MGRETNGHYSGLSLGSVHLHERIGGGGMGEIYKGYHDVLEMDVAVKVILPGQGTNEDLVKRFVREARACTQLSHPNILKVYNADKHDETYYIVMEFVDGTDLKQVLKRHKRIPWDQTIAIVEQAASGLAYAHKKGVVHRDIKPDNLLMTRVGEIKIADFGLALLRTEMTGVTSDGVFLGTPLYMSPEQCEGEVADWRADIYSLGATWYHLVAGRPPFIGDSPAAVIAQHMVKDVPFPDDLFGEVPPVIVDSLAQMMARKREHRMQSLDDLVERLRGLSYQSKGEQRQAVQQVVHHTRRLDGIRDSGSLPRPVEPAEHDTSSEAAAEAIPAPPVSEDSERRRPASDSQVEPRHPSSGRHQRPASGIRPGSASDATAPAQHGQATADPSEGQHAATQQAHVGAGQRPTTDSSGRLTTSSSSSRAQAASPGTARGSATSSRPWETLPGLGSTTSGRDAAPSTPSRPASSSSTTQLGPGAAASSSTSRLIHEQAAGSSGKRQPAFLGLLLVLLVLVLALAGGALVWLEPAWLFGEQAAPQDPAPTPAEGPRGPWVYFIGEETEGSSIWRVRPSGEQLERLTRSEGAKYWPAVSPDGRRLAFVDDASVMHLMDTADGGNHIAIPADSRHRRMVGPLAWFNGNRILVLDDNHTVLRATDGQSATLGLFHFQVTGEALSDFDIDRQRRRMIYGVRHSDDTLVVEDRSIAPGIEPGAPDRISERLEPRSDHFVYPRLSHDGERLAFLHLPEGEPLPDLEPGEANKTFGTIVVTRRNGRDADKHPIPGLRVYGPVGWLPDGRLLFTALDEQGRANLYAMPVPDYYDEPQPTPLLPAESEVRPTYVTAAAGP